MIASIGLAETELLILLLIFVVLFLTPILALIEILRSDFRQSNDKLIWVVVVLVLNLIGVLLYALIGRKQRIA